MSDNLWALARAFVVTVLFMPMLIKFLKQSKEQAVIRKLGPDHQAKSGTPSMGGALFVIAASLSALIGGGVANGWTGFTAMVLPTVAFLAYAVIGGIDDALKLINHADDGFAFKPKILAQTVSALVIMILMWVMNIPFTLYIPLFGTFYLGIFYFIFLWFWLVGWSNATNLTDGLDGLLTGISVIVYGAYTVIAMNDHNQTIVIFNFAILGALIGFLIFNKPKAKIFMGDTGSLALGAGLAIESILLGIPFSLVWFGLVFVIETVSVIVQTIGFHFWHKRIFPMAPIHHSFEKFGWSEWQIDTLFWIISAILAVAGIFYMN
ncbi:phospho-N-acetylmuramoyl-pentapeptide-transferase [Leuconostoc kimchii]|uniref:Phospho-N-acetylmuramoyl-pentapeptide-transferase n=2 Tax=Leuconostoc kimchii TaxID=136609 RepID=D5T169_LEUKI|nr:phospho-N-acetylmuramoyl-pentapeptide-transferase [Leuconostoc kimchii]ADG40018.1 phospho-N-acetylmuramoyl-pentapeptide-transferase [Leuconostoc kimchii IMSNU 11154]QBR47271.1 phospho-N-acetylmuramoyl-pentapeptide-transferase [Leuconostoc kimchii]